MGTRTCDASNSFTGCEKETVIGIGLRLVSNPSVDVNSAEREVDTRLNREHEQYMFQRRCRAKYRWKELKREGIVQEVGCSSWTLRSVCLFSRSGQSRGDTHGEVKNTNIL